MNNEYFHILYLLIYQFYYTNLYNLPQDISLLKILIISSPISSADLLSTKIMESAEEKYRFFLSLYKLVVFSYKLELDLSKGLIILDLFILFTIVSIDPSNRKIIPFFFRSNIF